MATKRATSAHRLTILLSLVVGLLAVSQAQADAVTDWNQRDNEIVSAANPNTPLANLALAVDKFMAH